MTFIVFLFLFLHGRELGHDVLSSNIADITRVSNLISESKIMHVYMCYAGEKKKFAVIRHQVDIYFSYTSIAYAK